MFRIRVFTPAALDEKGWRHAGGELVLGGGRICFLVDLSAWDIREYEQQWREGVARLVQGAPSTALMSAYRGTPDRPHLMWALWRDASHVYVQEHPVLPAELDAPFDPANPYPHVGQRIPASEEGLAIPEWRLELTDVIAANLGIRWPF
ncbi:MAG TPA: hypothetical protein VFU03_04725 [Gemmatimonadales bacterium]|nr:hypothetical protein [Gemmatimonadales bacterium]